MLSAVSKQGNPGFHRLKSISIHFSASRYPLAQSRDRHSPTSSTRSVFIKTGSVGTFRPVPAFVATKPSHRSQFPRVGMVLEHRRAHSTGQETRQHNRNQEDHMEKDDHMCRNGHTHSHEHNHSHSFPLFGHSHSHHEEHGRDAEKIIEALKGTGLSCWSTVL